MQKKALEFLIHLLFIILVASYFNNLFYAQITKPDGGTINEHIRFAENMLNGTPLNEARSLESLPHVGYFYVLIGLYELGLSFNQAAILVLSLAELLSFITTYIAFRYYLQQRIPDIFIVLAAAASIIISTLYLPFINPSPYFGQGSPNVHHNSTVILLKPIATLAFFLILSEFQRDKKRLSWMIGASLVFALSIMVKASFAIVFVPALGLWLLLQPQRKQNILWGSLILLPAVLLLLIQYLSYFQLAEHHRGIKFVFWAVWLMHSPNIPASIVQALAFPLLLCLSRWKNLKYRNFMLVAWFMTVFGIIQFAFIAETLNGEVLKSGNWISGLLMGLSLLYTVALLEYLEWASELRRSKPMQIVLFVLISLLMLAHLYSGISYDMILFRRGRIPLPD
jgi:hypothetical protein